MVLSIDFNEDVTKSSSATQSASLGSIRSLHDDALDWNQIQYIERRHCAILKQTEVSLFGMLMFWDSTVLQAILTEPMLWITMAVYFVIRAMARTSLLTSVSELGNTDISVVEAFLTFFMVFHSMNSFKRFDMLYKASMSCKENIFNIAAMAHTFLPRDRGLHLVRYINAAHVSGYVGKSTTSASLGGSIVVD